MGSRFHFEREKKRKEKKGPPPNSGPGLSAWKRPRSRSTTLDIPDGKPRRCLVLRFWLVGICFLLTRVGLPRGRTVSASKSWAVGLSVGRSREQPTPCRWPCSVRSLWAEDQKQAFDAIWGTNVSCFIFPLPFFPLGHCPGFPISLDT